MGPGFIESVYEQALCVELGLRQIPYVRQASFNVAFKGLPVGIARVDLLVDNCLIVELKSVAQLLPIHRSQLISYLRATNAPLGLLINFNVKLMKTGIRRVINSYPLCRFRAPKSSASR